MKLHLPALIFLLALLTVDLSPAGSLESISKHSSPSVTGSGKSFAPTFSPDGHFMVFVSEVKNLATNGAPSPFLDVYLRDLETGRTELVSVATNGVGGGNGNSLHPSVSSNGLHVVFQSDASNLLPNDTNGWTDIFWRNMSSGETRVITRSTNAMENARGGSILPLISADGRRIIFESGSWNLITNDLNFASTDIFTHDLESGITTAVSLNAEGTGTALERFFTPGAPRAVSIDPDISSDGRYVVFSSVATNIVAGATNGQRGIFARDLEAGITRWASSNALDFFPGLAGAEFIPHTVSGSGRYVFFQVYGAPPYAPAVLRYDIQDGSKKIVASNLAHVPFLSVSADGRFLPVNTTNALLLVDAENDTHEIICGEGVMPELKAWDAPVISADGSRVAFLGATSTNGPRSVYVFHRDSGSCELVSVTTNGAPAEVNPMSFPAINSDGSRVAFESSSSDIVSGDLNASSDVFVRDLVRGVTELVSQRAPERPSATPEMRSTLNAGCVSEFGRIIAFTSLAHSLADNDANTWQSAFVRDRITGATRGLTTPASTALGPDRLAFNPVVSADGRYVAWSEHAVPLPSGTRGATNIFWLDLQTGSNQVVDCAGLNFDGPPPALSHDGRWLAFAGFVPGNPYAQIFRRDMLSPGGTNELVTVNYTGSGPTTGDSAAPLFSRDGRWIVFTSRASSLVTNQPPLSSGALWAQDSQSRRVHLINGLEFSFSGITNTLLSANSRYVFFQARSRTLYRHDLKTLSRTNLLVCEDCAHPAVNEDGNLVAFERRSASGNFDIYLRDLRTSETSLISSNVFGDGSTGGNGNSLAPQISGDGRYVVFASRASNLVPDDTNGATDLFVHDRTTGTTLLVSRNALGVPGRGSSSAPVLAPDGRTILFTSSADDFTADDFNNTGDIFLLRLEGSDSDTDGMDDEWESARFDTLARDGTGDFDSDGSSDLHEFRAGTNPTDSGSVFRFITVESVDGGGRTLIWQAQPGQTYRVQFKSSLNDSYWTDLPNTVTALGATASLTDEEPDPSRYYRVLLAP